MLPESDITHSTTSPPSPYAHKISIAMQDIHDWLPKTMTCTTPGCDAPVAVVVCRGFLNPDYAGYYYERCKSSGTSTHFVDWRLDIPKYKGSLDDLKRTIFDYPPPLTMHHALQIPCTPKIMPLSLPSVPDANEEIVKDRESRRSPSPSIPTIPHTTPGVDAPEALQFTEYTSLGATVITFRVPLTPSTPTPQCKVPGCHWPLSLTSPRNCTGPRCWPAGSLSYSPQRFSPNCKNEFCSTCCRFIQRAHPAGEFRCGLKSHEPRKTITSTRPSPRKQRPCDGCSYCEAYAYADRRDQYDESKLE
ncbi:hypothetical protein CPC08DRAFT_138930 [Agrocybe pediades]|nr:hypothetical protein CPC08DRAFT_138930 [Agrocybe pediades]